MGFKTLVRNLRLIHEHICPVCKEKCKSEEEAKNHCLKIGRFKKNGHLQ